MPRVSAARSLWGLVKTYPLRCAVLAGLLAAAPSLLTPLSTDDWLQHVALAAYWDDAPVPAWFDGGADPFGFVNAYGFITGDPERTSELRRVGAVPWWAPDELKLRFYRPIACLLMSADYFLWPLWSVGYRLHSLVWWVLTICAYGLVLRRAAPRSTIAPLALILFAVTDKHFIPISWVANRHVMVCAAAGAVGLWAYMRWREEGWWQGGWLSPLAQAVALLVGETAVGLYPFYVAYEVFGARPRRLRALVPVSAVCLGWAAGYAGLGLGTYASGFYASPFQEPLAYLEALVLHGPTLLQGAMAGVKSELWFIFALRPYLLLSAGVMVVIVVATLRHAWPRLSSEEQRATTWLGLAGLAALLPAVVAEPSDRLLIVPELGLTFVVALILRHAWRLRAESYWFGIYARVLIFRHLVFVWIAWWLGTGLVWLASVRADGATEMMSMPPDVAERRIALINASDTYFAMYLRAVRFVRGMPSPESWFVWSMSPRDHELRRIDERTLELRGVGDEPSVMGFGALFRGSGDPLRVGDVVELEGHRIRVTETDEGGVRSVSIELLDDAWLFYAQRGEDLIAVELPKVGQVLELPHHAGPFGL